ncbi:CPBP family intramembrane glutamic endopeptidase [Granulicella sp. dw_53]|uniref:CPBP family intramembrane glutamic endopeptidase n=1 Tax=Granulicella sp. dw_53 TaxID=2719792 RepID=UPI001BD20715|nr:CPBP family intramembrane glutamic endopeptidase [Granulicella sp. dw_53]
MIPRPADQRVEDQPGDLPVPRPIVPILPSGEIEAIVLPPLDNTPNDAPNSDPPARIPHLGHAVLFLAITGAILLFSQFFLGYFHERAAAVATQTIANPTTATKAEHALADISPRLLLASEAFTYIATLTISWFLFPLLWHRSFPVGLQTNAPAAGRNALRLVPIGITLSFVVQAVSSLITMPKSIPMDDFFRNPTDVWLITAFGTILAPLFEETLFRGFLLPGFAIAYDWLSLPRIPAAREQWNSSNALSFPALAFSAVLTSILFALLHGQQTAFTWPVLLLLFCVSLILTAIRIRLRSVFASALVHASYNFAVFLTAFLATGGYRHLDRLTR